MRTLHIGIVNGVRSKKNIYIYIWAVVVTQPSLQLYFMHKWTVDFPSFSKWNVKIFLVYRVRSKDVKYMYAMEQDSYSLTFYLKFSCVKYHPLLWWCSPESWSSTICRRPGDFLLQRIRVKFETNVYNFYVCALEILQYLNYCTVWAGFIFEKINRQTRVFRSGLCRCNARTLIVIQRQ